MLKPLTLLFSTLAIAGCSAIAPAVGSRHLSHAERQKACALAQRGNLHRGMTTANELLSAPVEQDGKIVCGTFFARPRGSTVQLDTSSTDPLPFEHRILLDFPHPKLINQLRDDEVLPIFLVGKVVIDQDCFKRSPGGEYLHSCVPFPPPIIIRASYIAPAAIRSL